MGNERTNERTKPTTRLDRPRRLTCTATRFVPFLFAFVFLPSFRFPVRMWIQLAGEFRRRHSTVAIIITIIIFHLLLFSAHFSNESHLTVPFQATRSSSLRLFSRSAGQSRMMGELDFKHFRTWHEMKLCASVKTVERGKNRAAGRAERGLQTRSKEKLFSYVCLLRRHYISNK